MRLASVEVIPYALPFKEPYVTARGVLTKREMVLLRLRDEEGPFGLGEAVPLSLRGGETIEQVIRELDALAEVAKLDPEGFAADIDPRLLSAPARCAAETALWDLEQRLDGAEGARAPVSCNATLIAAEPAAVAANAEAWAAEGYATFKLKLGVGDDAGQVRAVREALGPAAKIRVDANAAWSVEEAIAKLGAIAPFDIELAEQPVATLIEMAQLAAATEVPIAADESVTNLAEATAAARIQACAATGVKLSKVGGWREATAIAGELPVYYSSALDGPVGIAAAGVLASGLDESQWALAHGLATQRLFASTIAAVECELRDGRLHLPPGPGLGVEIDEDALQAHRL